MTIITVPYTTRTAGPYTASADQTAFSYGFPIYDEADLIVYRDRAGVLSTLVLTTDYTVSGVGEQSGGTVTLAVGSQEGDIITIDGGLEPERASSFLGGVPFKAAQIDLDLNRLAVMVQELNRQVSRAILRAPVDVLGGDLTLPWVIDETTLLALDTSGNIIGLLSNDFFQGVEGAGVGGPEGGVTDGHAALFDGASGNLIRSAGFVPRSASSPVPIVDLQEIATARILGRVSASTGAVESLTVAQLLALIATGDPFIGTSGGIIRSAIGAVNGLVITNNAGLPTTALDIDASDAVLVDASGTGIRTGIVDLTINASGNGANGLDTGSLANDTWYNSHVIYNPSTMTLAGLLSLSATAPTMPSGYTYSYRVGAIRTGGSATFLRVRQVGDRAQYTVVASSTTPNLPIMQSGTSGSTTAPTWTAVPVGAYVPPTAKIISVVVKSEGDNERIIVAPNNAYGAYDSATNPPPFTSYTDAGTGAHAYPGDMVLESTDVYYAAVSNIGSDPVLLACFGWVDAVNAN